MFVTFEGMEGSGKSTALAGVAERLEAMGMDVVCTREPGGSELGRTVRTLLLDAKRSMVPEAELFLFLADRAQHVAEVIRPALARGAMVLCDRFTDSTLAYQGHARKLDLQVLASFNQAATGGLEPDLTLLFDLPVEEGLRRVEERRAQLGDEGYDRLDAEKRAFHEAVRAGFRLIAEQAPSRVCVLDATLSKEEVLCACLEAIQARGSTGEGEVLSSGLNSLRTLLQASVPGEK